MRGREVAHVGRVVNSRRILLCTGCSCPQDVNFLLADAETPEVVYSNLLRRLVESRSHRMEFVIEGRGWRKAAGRKPLRFSPSAPSSIDHLSEAIMRNIGDVINRQPSWVSLGVADLAICIRRNTFLTTLSCLPLSSQTPASLVIQLSAPRISHPVCIFTLSTPYNHHFLPRGAPEATLF